MCKIMPEKTHKDKVREREIFSKNYWALLANRLKPVTVLEICWASYFK